MGTHKIIVIRNREISVIFTIRVSQALVTSDSSIPFEYIGICGMTESVMVARTGPLAIQLNSHLRLDLIKETLQLDKYLIIQ